MLFSIPFETLPDKTNISPFFIFSNFWNKISTLSLSIIGPVQLIAVSSVLEFFAIFTLILEFAFCNFTKSVFILYFSISSLILSPVKPAINPNVVVSMPKEFKTIETLIPLPPGNIISWLLLLIFPISKFSIFII